MSIRKKLIIKRGDLTLCEVCPPTRPYKNLEHFRREMCSYWGSNSNDPSFWPCLACLGAGWVYDPREKPCVVEGNKMRTKLSCTGCRGTGRGHRAIIKEAYEERITEFEQEKAIFDDDLDTFFRAVSNLADDEISILSAWFGKLERSPYTTYEDEVIEV